MSTDFYISELFCDHCDKFTDHRCKDSGHERDSSYDYQECLVCEWWACGYTGFKYEPPFPEHDGSITEKNNEM